MDARLEQPGFFPAGGGRIAVRTSPSQEFRPLALEARGAIIERRARALVSRIPLSIGDREIATITKQTSLTSDECRVDAVESVGPGNAVVITMRHEHGAEVFTGFGEQGRRAEAVATQAVQAMQAWHGADVPVGPHLADQLLLPMALGAGGTFRTMRLTPHTTTNRDVIAAFLGDVVTFEDDMSGRAAAQVRVTVRGLHNDTAL